EVGERTLSVLLSGKMCKPERELPQRRLAAQRLAWRARHRFKLAKAFLMETQLQLAAHAAWIRVTAERHRNCLRKNITAIDAVLVPEAQQVIDAKRLAQQDRKSVVDGSGGGR